MPSAERRRKAARSRVEARRDRPGCPRPDKAAYDLSDLDEARLAERRGALDMALYRCRCGYWHHGH